MVGFLTHFLAQQAPGVLAAGRRLGYNDTSSSFCGLINCYLTVLGAFVQQECQVRLATIALCPSDWLIRLVHSLLVHSLLVGHHEHPLFQDLALRVLQSNELDSFICATVRAE